MNLIELFHVLAMACSENNSVLIQQLLETHFIPLSVIPQGRRKLGAHIVQEELTNEALESLLSIELTRTFFYQYIASWGKRLVRAIDHQNIRGVEILLTAYPQLCSIATDYGNSLLSTAIDAENEQIIDILIKSGSDVNGDLSESSSFYRSNQFSYLYPQMLIPPALNTPQHLIHFPARIRPLHLAVIRENLKVIEKLIDAHANINQSNAYPEVDPLPRVKKHKVDTKLGITPLMFAAYLGNMDVLNLLLMHGPDLNAQDEKGRTALMYAMRFNQKEIIEQLLVHGANTELKDHKGRTCMDLMSHYGHPDAREPFKLLEKKKVAFNKVFADRPEAVVTKDRSLFPHWLTPVATDGSRGDCLYHAVRMHLAPMPSTVELREQVALYVDAHRADYEGSIEGSMEDYIAGIRLGAWGDHVEIDALMHLTQRPIIIMHANGSAPTLPENSAAYPGQPIFVYYNDEDHYSGLLVDPRYSPEHRLNQIQLGHNPRSLFHISGDLRLIIASYLTLNDAYKLMGGVDLFNSMASQIILGSDLSSVDFHVFLNETPLRELYRLKLPKLTTSIFLTPQSTVPSSSEEEAAVIHKSNP
jgi:ankyrin repeat protein